MLYQSVQCVIVKNLKFLKEQEARGLLSNLTELKYHLSDLSISKEIF